MKALEAAAIQALHSGWPGSLCSLLPKILGLQQFCSGTDKYPQGSWPSPAPSPPPGPSRKQTDILLYIHTPRAGTRTHRQDRQERGKSRTRRIPQDPILEVCPAEQRPRPQLHAQPPSLGPGIRVPVGKARLGCSPAAPRPGIQLDVAVMGLSSSRSRLELPGWRLL